MAVGEAIMKYEHLTWVEFKELIQSIKTIIIPWGSLEAHGTHLPLATDTIIANYFAELIAEKINAMVLPAIPIGYCFHAATFPGTLSLTISTLKRVACEMVEGLHSQGIQTVLFLSGHGDQVDLLEEVSEELQQNLNMKVAVLYPFFTESEIVKRFNEIKTSKSLYDIFHAEELETSLMLAISPHLVQFSEAKMEYPEISKNQFESGEGLGILSKYCVFGDPTVATAEKGKKFIAIMLEELGRILQL